MVRYSTLRLMETPLIKHYEIQVPGCQTALGITRFYEHQQHPVHTAANLSMFRMNVKAKLKDPLVSYHRIWCIRLGSTL